MPNDSAHRGYLTPTDTVADDFALLRQFNNLVAGTSGLPRNRVFPAYQPEALPEFEPTVDWAAISVNSIVDEKGSPYLRHYPDGNGYTTLEQNKLLTLLVIIYGPNCYSYANIFVDGLKIDQNWETAREQGLVFRSASEPSRLVPELKNNRWYRRVDVTITVSHEVKRTYNIFNILRATGLIHGDADRNEDIQQTFDTENV